MEIHFRHMLRFFGKLLHILFVTLILALMLVALFRPGWIELFLKWIEGIIALLGNWNYFIGFGSSIIESFPAIGVLVPGQQIMLLVGGFFGKNHLPEMIVVASFGALIGNYVGYLLGVRYGEWFFWAYGDYFGLGKTELHYLQSQIEKNGAWFVILGKFHNFTRSFIPFIAGSMGMKQRTFLLYNAIGSILWASSIITLGVVFVQYYKMVLDSIGYVFIGIFAAFALYVYFFKREAFKKYLVLKEQELFEKEALKKSKK